MSPTAAPKVISNGDGENILLGFSGAIGVYLAVPDLISLTNRACRDSFWHE
jgi:hypothetical protein